MRLNKYFGFSAGFLTFVFAARIQWKNRDRPIH